MSELRDRLESAVGGAFAIERELGQGGMATVFLARDLRHERLVAIKVFLPEFAAAFGHGRFLREIRTAAGLNHPNILALHDSGEAEGLLYYVMPYVPGDSLSQRLARDGALPIGEALDITRQVAAALQYAHTHGVVHRDIKPGNILLADGTAYVADFGIAHALEETGEKLTSTGIAIGTPAYMSPEQSGSAKLDGRADIYSLGCVLYEMLTGEPPYSGRSAQVILARHSVERVPSARAVRDTIPPAVEQAVHRALAKMPADRFATAAEFAEALSPEQVSRVVAVEPERTVRIPARGIIGGAVIFALGAAVLAVLALWPEGKAPAAPNPDVVAIMPFEVPGTADSAMTALATKLPAAIRQHLPGPAGLRGVLAADSLTAGLRLTGEVFSWRGGLVLGAKLKRAADDSVLVSIEKLTGLQDSLTSVLDRLTARVLMGHARLPVQDRPALAKLSLPQLRTYLVARRAFFQGDFPAAINGYLEVLKADSTLVPAAFGLINSGRYIADTLRQRGVALAWAIRSQLTPPDSLYLLALAGPRWPLRSDRVETQLAWDRAARYTSDRAELWFRLGESLFHEGPWTGAPDVLTRARAVFRSAVALEPNFVSALGHLIDIAASEGDTADVRALGSRYLAIDSVGDLADYYRWRVALALNDDAGLRRIRARLDSLSLQTLERMMNVAQLDGVALDDGLRAATALWSRGAASDRARWGYTKRREILLNLGRPGEAAALQQSRIASIPLRRRDDLSEVVDALYGDADTLLAAELVRRNGAEVDQHLRHPANPADTVYYDVCAVGLWRASRRDWSRVPAITDDLRRAARVYDQLPESAGVQGSYLELCAAVLEGQRTEVAGTPDLRATAERIDSVARLSDAFTWVLAAANLTASRLWEKLGDPSRALTAVGRRVYITDLNERRILVALPTFLREEGRLAARVGDTARAIRAYRKYLALRARPEAPLAAQAGEVKAALAALERSAARSPTP